MTIPKMRNADMLDIPEVGPRSAGEDTVDLANQIDKLGLQVETLIPVHGKMGTIADLRGAVAGNFVRQPEVFKCQMKNVK